MDNMLREIYDILTDGYKFFSMNVCNKEVWFNIYETEVPIIVDFKTGYCYLDTEASDLKIDADMMIEIYNIMLVINANIDNLKKMVGYEE